MVETFEAVGGFRAGRRIVTTPDTALADRVEFDGAALFVRYASASEDDLMGKMGLRLGATAPYELLRDCGAAIRADGGPAFAALVLPQSRSTLRAVRFGDEVAG